MKLPDDPKEKTKILILVAIGVLATVSVVTQALLYTRNRKKELRETLDEVQWKSQAATRDVLSAERVKQRNDKTVAAIAAISRHHVLQPILGNYRLGATDILNRHAALSGLTVHSIQEIGILDLPKPSGTQSKKAQAANVFKAYTVRLTLNCGYFDLWRFLQSIEEDNPFVCISSLSIVLDEDDDPESHRVVLGIQWPIWSDPERAAQFKATAVSGEENAAKGEPAS